MQNFKQKNINHFSYSLWMVLVLILGCNYPMLAQKDSDPYNLSFRYEKGQPFAWKGAIIAIRIDSTKLINGKYPLQWWGGFNEKIRAIARPLYGILSQRIPLPKINSDTLSIELYNKTHNIEQATILINSFGECETLLRKDSMSILSPEKWDTHILKIPCQSIRFVDIHIMAIATRALENLKEDYYNYINFDKMKIKIDHKDLYTYDVMPSINDQKESQFSEKYIYPISNDRDKSYSQLRGKKIIGLGEMMHYNPNINKIAFDICKYQIKNNNTRIIFIEQAYHSGFIANWFVTCNNPTEKIKKVIKDNFQNCFSENFIEFLDWLREYNQTRERKVLIIGMDRPIIQEYTKDPLATVLSSVPCPDSDTIQIANIIHLLNQYQNEKALEEIIKYKKTILSLLGEMNGQMFIDYAERLVNDFPSKFVDKRLIELSDSRTYIYLRDQAMFNNINKEVSMYLNPDETALVYGHLEHIGRGPTTLPWTPLGYLMNQKYGENYFPIGITAGKGQIIGPNKDGTHRIIQLMTPPENSIEHEAMKINYPMFYYQLQENNKPLIQTHNIMPATSDYDDDFQFKLISPKTRMDGLIFIRENYQETTKNGQDTP